MYPLNGRRGCVAVSSSFLEGFESMLPQEIIMSAKNAAKRTFSSARKLGLFVATRKGLWILKSDAARGRWTLDGPTDRRIKRESSLIGTSSSRPANGQPPESELTPRGFASNLSVLHRRLRGLLCGRLAAPAIGSVARVPGARARSTGYLQALRTFPCHLSVITRHGRKRTVRRLSRDGRAVRLALVFGSIERRGTVQRTAVVPHHRVAIAPWVAVDAPVPGDSG